ncbi:MAG: nicotinate phosphoribosyltransferase [Buchnera aphidicola (Meitanaphis elongallis)]
MKKYDYPILKTFLDTDAYKFHMQQAVFFYYNDVTVSAEFICRGTNFFGNYSEILINQIEMMTTNLYLTNEEYMYMSSLPFFRKEYLLWLKDFRYNASQVRVFNKNGKLCIRIHGLWKEVILWEVPLLSLISEIVHKYESPNITSQIALNYLRKKITNFYKITKNLDVSKLKIIDFGTRRRFSYNVHFSVIKFLKNNFPWLVGSSNYHISKTFGIDPVGTQSHEWFQAHQQISSNLKNSQKMALRTWLLQYKKQLGIALTDCISMDSFLRDFNFNLANRYQGLRHDSGDPFVWGEKAINHYKSLGINPLKKTLLFSDNLNFKKIVRLFYYFNDKINTIFGIGTKLTCDIPNVNPLNIVIKLIECNGKPVAKISDSLEKIVCLDRSFMQDLKKAFDLQ